MIGRIALLALLLAGPALAADECSPLQVVIDEEIAARVDHVVDTALASGFAGGVAILRDGVLVYDRVAGTADLDGDIAVADKTLFNVASIAKYFTAALVLRAAEDGVLNLEDSIAPFVGGGTVTARDVTFMDLLAHRSGLGSSYAAEGIRDQHEALAAIDAAGVDESRAGSFRYSNDGYDILGIVLERIYKRSYEELMREKLVTPACLSNIGFWGETDLDDPNFVSQPLRPVPDSIRGRNYGMLASGGILTTAVDLVAWQHAVRNGSLLTDSSVEQLFLPRGTMSLGEAAFGSFILEHAELGRVISARGYEDWGDNAFLNDYVDCGISVAIVTSRGPAENSGEEPFRVSILNGIEEVLATTCH